MIHCRTKCHMPRTNDSLVIAVKPKAEYRHRLVTILFCIYTKSVTT